MNKSKLSEEEFRVVSKKEAEFYKEVTKNILNKSIWYDVTHPKTLKQLIIVIILILVLIFILYTILYTIYNQYERIKKTKEKNIKKMIL